MIEVIILLLIGAFAYLLTSLIFPGYPLFARNKSLKGTDTLTHQDILQLLQRLDYWPVEIDGVCHGFTLNWALAAANKSEDYFFSLLNTLKQHKAVLLDKSMAISDKVKNHQALNQNDRRIAELPSLLGLICLAQSPDVYHEVYNKPLAQSDINAILKMIRFQKTPEHKTAQCVYQKTLPCASKAKLYEYLQQTRLLVRLEDHVAIVAGSEEHSLGFRVHPNGWLFMDINNLYKQSKDYPQQILSTSALTERLYETLFEKGDHFILSTCFIANRHASLLHRLKKLDLMFPVTKKNMAITNSRGYGLLPIAAQSNDIPTVREVLTLGSQPTALDKTQLRRTFYYAAAYNHVAILNMLRQKTGLDMNSPCDSDQNSMLCLACREGHTEAVMELLDDPRVNVNYANKEGQTPLMLACTSECTTTNWDLFSALLKRGANPLSPEGKPILALAMVYNNEAAINAINAFQPSPTIKDDDSILKRCLTKAYGHFFPAPISLQPQVSSPMDKPSI
ncbi:Dot/Icm T4SS effector AnkG/AnkZ/LegA7 [Legionella erythra]|uniref:Ankyrin repeat-containing protein n=1 Tax=Legionella erythra TaxID=448 RepID=A0A0W0TG54_LEGER|nr:Dot/Icm T4SS effector AnkG/AnkZ/LegA7 [Legionella erythra]KTC94547.1 ankyrin repeat-containing protein [Legionella erythra]